MATEQRDEVRTVEGRNYARRERVVETAPTMQRVLVARITQLIWLIMAVIVGLLAFRLVLALIGANPASGFVNFIYTLTNPLVWPFVGIVGTPNFGGGSVLDVAALFAMVVYPLFAWVLVTLFRIMFKDARGVRRVQTVERQR
jgi:uncharacterized protein YggT (Ycf19 family)